MALNAVLPVFEIFFIITIIIFVFYFVDLM